MSKRQQRLKRIAAIEQEYLAAATAADWLAKQLKADPSFGDQYGWEGRGGLDFSENVETTYIVRIYAEFEAGLRDYWRNYLGKDTKPGMAQLVRDAIPARQWFKQDDIDNALKIVYYRNFLVHEPEDETPQNVTVFTVKAAKRHLSAYFSRLDYQWT